MTDANITQPAADTVTLSHEDMYKKFSEVFAKLINDTNDPEVNMLRTEFINKMNKENQDLLTRITQLTVKVT